MCLFLVLCKFVAESEAPILFPDPLRKTLYGKGPGLEAGTNSIEKLLGNNSEV